MKILAWPRDSASNPIFGVVNQFLSDTYGITIEEFAAAKLLVEKYDVWHVHFPETVLYHREVWRALPRIVALRLLVEFVKLRGTKLVWTANNLASHERHHPRLERWLWSFFLRRLDAFVTHSESGADTAREHHGVLKGKRHFVVPEPHFRSVRYDDVGREEAREYLGMPHSAKLALFVGRVRPYKCVEHLISVFRDCRDDDLWLIIAGRPHSFDLARRLEEQAGQERRIKLVLRHIPEIELQYYLSGCDTVVLPYREIFLSGTALLALSYDRPIVVPARGALKELAREVGPAWVRLYDGELTPEELTAAMRWAQSPRPTGPDLRRHDLDMVTAALQKAYRALLA